MDLALVGFCGVDCSACPDYLGERCLGCRQTVWDDGDACMPVTCCEGRGIACCGQCAGFPCADMAEFYEESDGHREAHERMLRLRASLGL